MSRDYFAILGLTPGRHDPREVARRFHRRRQNLIERLGNPREHHAVREQLEALAPGLPCALRACAADRIRTSRAGPDGREPPPNGCAG